MGRKSIAHIRRKQIIEGFFKIVAEKGFANASIREITEAAGVSKGVLHHYFTNKEAMVLGVLDYVVTTYTAEFHEEITSYTSATDRMKFLFSWFLDLKRFDLEFSRAWMEFWVLSKTNPAISEALTGCYRAVKSLIAEIIRDGIKAGEFREVDPDITANLILGSLEGGTVLWVVDKEAMPVETTSRKRAELFLNYLKREKT